MIQIIRISIEKKTFEPNKGYEPTDEGRKTQPSSTLSGLFRAANEVQVTDTSIANVYRKLGIVKV